MNLYNYIYENNIFNYYISKNLSNFDKYELLFKNFKFFNSILKSKADKII